MFSTISWFQALDNFNTAVVSPIYYALFTAFTILASAIMFKVGTFQKQTFKFACGRRHFMVQVFFIILPLLFMF